MCEIFLNSSLHSGSGFLVSDFLLACLKLYATSDDSSNLVNNSAHFNVPGCPGANLQFGGLSLLCVSTSLWTIRLAMSDCHVT